MSFSKIISKGNLDESEIRNIVKAINISSKLKSLLLWRIIMVFSLVVFIYSIFFLPNHGALAACVLSLSWIICIFSVLGIKPILMKEKYLTELKDLFIKDNGMQRALWQLNDIYPKSAERIKKAIGIYS